MAGDLNLSLEGIGGLLGSVGSAAKDIRAAITGKAILDPAAQAALEEKLAEIEEKTLEANNQIALAQANINLAEANSPSLFKSGWRPFIGWGCGVGFLTTAFLLPVISWVSVVWLKYNGSFPVVDSTSINSLLYGLLGISGLRTAEKFKGVSAK